MAPKWEKLAKQFVKAVLDEAEPDEKPARRGKRTREVEDEEEGDISRADFRKLVKGFEAMSKRVPLPQALAGLANGYQVGLADLLTACAVLAAEIEDEDQGTLIEVIEDAAELAEEIEGEEER